MEYFEYGAMKKCKREDLKVSNEQWDVMGL